LNPFDGVTLRVKADCPPFTILVKIFGKAVIQKSVPAAAKDILDTKASWGVKEIGTQLTQVGWKAPEVVGKSGDWVHPVT
jgi:hypothetical protein